MICIHLHRKVSIFQHPIRNIPLPLMANALNHLVSNTFPKLVCTIFLFILSERYQPFCINHLYSRDFPLAYPIIIEQEISLECISQMCSQQ